MVVDGNAVEAKYIWLVPMSIHTLVGDRDSSRETSHSHTIHTPTSSCTAVIQESRRFLEHSLDQPTRLVILFLPTWTDFCLVPSQTDPSSATFNLTGRSVMVGPPMPVPNVFISHAGNEGCL